MLIDYINIWRLKNKEFKDSTFFEGDWINNKREGKGIFKYPDVAVYEGEMKNNKEKGNFKMGKFIKASLKSY